MVFQTYLYGCPLTSEFRRAAAYKTVLCQAFRDKGSCDYGEACRYAHGEEDLRLRPLVNHFFDSQFESFYKCYLI